MRIFLLKYRAALRLLSGSPSASEIAPYFVAIKVRAAAGTEMTLMSEISDSACPYRSGLAIRPITKWKA
jgi:hypothetical protein